MDKPERAGVLERVETFLARKAAPPGKTLEGVWIVTGDDHAEFGELLRHALLFHQRSRIQVVPWSSVVGYGEGSATPLPASIVGLSLTEDLPESDLDAWCARRVLPWTRCAVDEMAGIADVGPSFLSGKTFCYQCFRALYTPWVGKATAPRYFDFPFANFLCHLFARELVKSLVANDSVVLQQGFRRYDLQGMAARYRLHTSLPSCSCRNGKHAPAEDLPVKNPLVPAALAFEDAVARQPTPSYSPDQAKRSAALVHASLFRQEFPNSRRMYLPALGENRSAGVVSLAALTELLFYSVGLRWIHPSRQSCARFAASAGNLGSSQISFAVSEADGIDAGLYRYRAVSHDLVHVESRAGATLLLCLPPGSGRGRRALILFSAAYGRLQQKYGSFAYKLMYIDAGVAFSQASLVAASLGLVLELYAEEHRTLAQRALNSNVDDECVLILACLSPIEHRSPLATREHESCRLPDSAVTPEVLSKASALDLAEHLLQTSFAIRTPVRDVSATQDAKQMPQTSRKAMPEAVMPRIPAVFFQRTSIRQFRAEPISTQVIATLLRSLHRNDANMNGTMVGKASFRFFLLEDASNPSRRRLLEFDSLSDQMHDVQVPVHSHFAPSLYVDGCFQSARAAIWVVGNLEAWSEAHGTRGHQLMLFHAGRLANDLWLLALTSGLQGAICAGLIPSVARHELGFDGWEKSAVCAVLLSTHGTALACST